MSYNAKSWIIFGLWLVIVGTIFIVGVNGIPHHDKQIDKESTASYSVEKDKRINNLLNTKPLSVKKIALSKSLIYYEIQYPDLLIEVSQELPVPFHQAARIYYGANEATGQHCIIDRSSLAECNKLRPETYNRIDSLVKTVK